MDTLKIQVRARYEAGEWRFAVGPHCPLCKLDPAMAMDTRACPFCEEVPSMPCASPLCETHEHVARWGVATDTPIREDGYQDCTWSQWL